jgi:hypothetical protein
MFENVDHVMTYLFTDADEIPGFNVLGRALDEAGRMPLRLPSVGYMTADFAGKVAAPRAVAGADVLPWRPSTGVYLVVEEGQASPADLAGVPGVAGVWWHHGRRNPAPYPGDSLGRQITWCFLDADPVETAVRLEAHMRSRWASGAVKGLLAAPFHTIVPFAWDRYLP